MVPRQQSADGRSVRGRILRLHPRVVREALHVINEFQPADVDRSLPTIVVCLSVAGEKVLELYPVEALCRATTSRFHEQMLLRVRISIQIDHLPAYVPEGLVERKHSSR